MLKSYINNKVTCTTCDFLCEKQVANLAKSIENNEFDIVILNVSDVLNVQSAGIIEEAINATKKVLNIIKLIETFTSNTKTNNL